MKKKSFFESIFNNEFFRQIFVFWKALTSSWRVYLEKPLPMEELQELREAASIPSFGFFFLLICATVIATLGLILDSTAIIIGAMIVAPLMNPILSMSFGIITANWKLYKRSLITVALGVGCTIFISFLISLIIPLDIVGEEILGRTRPNLIDLGVAIAAGAAGSFSLTRKSIASSIAGVAIAVALVPPLCVTGISLAIGEEMIAPVSSLAVSYANVSQGAFLLFLVNLAGITFTACLIFLSQSYGRFPKAFQTIFIWFLIIVLLCGPLTGSMKKLLVNDRVTRELRIIIQEKPQFAGKIMTHGLNIELEGSTAYIYFLLTVPQDLMTDEFDQFLQTSEERIFNSLTQTGITSIEVNVRIIPIEVKRYRGLKSKL